MSSHRSSLWIVAYKKHSIPSTSTPAANAGDEIQREFVCYYNTERYHESLNNLTPEDVYTGRGRTVLNRRRRIKQKLWLNDVDYTTDERPLNYELDERKVSLKSGRLQSGIL